MQVRDAEIAAGTRPKKLLDLDVGYHQELEAANKRLEMDNRLMAPRVRIHSFVSRHHTPLPPSPSLFVSRNAGMR